jgi:hypothetical protein
VCLVSQTTTNTLTILPFLLCYLTVCSLRHVLSSKRLPIVRRLIPSTHCPADHRNARQTVVRTRTGLISPRATHEAMSGFISTMFVSSAPSPDVSFPAKPKPLLPISTFAQSQSCMNLRMDLDILDLQETGRAGDVGSNISDASRARAGLDLARPRDSYQSPLQRIG